MRIWPGKSRSLKLCVIIKNMQAMVVGRWAMGVLGA
jgi:hypothetical protein